MAEAGTYRIVLTVDGQDYSKNVRVEADPVLASAVPADELREMEKAEQEDAERHAGDDPNADRDDPDMKGRDPDEPDRDKDTPHPDIDPHTR